MIPLPLAPPPRLAAAMIRALALALTLASCNRAAPERPAPPDPPSPRAVHRPAAGLDADLAATRAFAATRPTEETPLDDGLLPVQGVGATSAAICGACHVEIYEEWRRSTHAHAWTDPQFQAEVKKSDNLWLCRNCHTPLRAQQPFWPVELVDGDVEAPVLVPNASFDEALMLEGITCDGFHVREGRIHGPGLPDSAAPHPVVADPALRSEAICVRCHQAEREYPGKTFVCTFTTGAEWAASAHAAEGRTCQACHMPEIERPAATGGPQRTVRRHWFKGSGIPKFADLAPPPDAAPGPGLALEVAQDGDHVVITAVNAGAGHTLPSGDPERWIAIEAHFSSEAGPTGAPWATRIGQEWTWHPKPERVGDTRLQPGERRDHRAPIPPGASRVEVRASSHRMSQQNADYHGLAGYPLSIPTHAITRDLAPVPAVGADPEAPR